MLIEFNLTFTGDGTHNVKRLKGVHHYQATTNFNFPQTIELMDVTDFIPIFGNRVRNVELFSAMQI